MSELKEFTCNVYALTAVQREHHNTVSNALFAKVRDVQETDNGYQFRLSYTPDILPEIADFITHESLCCPFFAFQVTVEADQELVALELSGANGIKPFIVAELDHLLTEDVAIEAGFKERPI